MEKTLRDALHETICNSDVKMRPLADLIGMSYSYLANAANPNMDEFHFQLKHLMPLIKATGNFAVLDYLENACGRVAFALPVAGKDNLEITSGLLELMSKMGSLANKMREILADGQIEPHEYKQVEPEFFGMFQELARLMASTSRAVQK